MPELGVDAPAFDGIGDRLKPAWMQSWLLDPKSIRPDARMPRLLTGPNAAADASDIAAYLGTVRASASSTEPPLNPGNRGDLAEDGAWLFGNLGCVACHSLPGGASLANDPRVPLNHVEAKWQPRALETFLRAPAEHFHWTRMPDFNLTDPEAAALSVFLLDRTVVAPVAGQDESLRSIADAQRGGQLVATLGCLSCHTLATIQDRSQPLTLAKLAVGNWNQGCLADDTTARGKAPDFAFDPSQRTALRTFARDGFADALGRDAAAEFAERSYRTLQCNACHPRDLETDRLTQLGIVTPKPANPYDDEESARGGSVHLGRPLLTFAGEKLYAGWMRRCLEGTLSYKPRPELEGRMPAFTAYAGGIAEGMANQHGYPNESTPPPEVDPQLAAVGEALTQVSGGFSCVSCHSVGSQTALAGKDTATVNFACVGERLRPGYYWRYVHDPPRLVPSTMMPKFIGKDGKTSIKTVFEGDPQRQFTAIWHYLQSLRPETGPE